MPLPRVNRSLSNSNNKPWIPSKTCRGQSWFLIFHWKWNFQSEVPNGNSKLRTFKRKKLASLCIKCYNIYYRIFLIYFSLNSISRFAFFKLRFKFVAFRLKILIWNSEWCKTKQDETWRARGNMYDAIARGEKLKNQSHGQPKLTHRSHSSTPGTIVSASFYAPEGNTYVRCKKEPCRDCIAR